MGNVILSDLARKVGIHSLTEGLGTIANADGLNCLSALRTSGGDRQYPLGKIRLAISLGFEVQGKLKSF
jgi:hypothetical protein